MSRGLVTIVPAERFVDMAGNAHDTFAAAHRASVHGLLTAALVDQGITVGQRHEKADAVASALLEQFVIVPRETR